MTFNQVRMRVLLYFSPIACFMSTRARLVRNLNGYTLRSGEVGNGLETEVVSTAVQNILKQAYSYCLYTLLHIWFAATHPCHTDNGHCQTLCLSIPGGYKCRCKAGYVYDKTRRSCVQSTSTASSTTPTTTPPTTTTTQVVTTPGTDSFTESILFIYFLKFYYHK